MVKARFLCVHKSGIETFTVKLVPVLVDICPECGSHTSKDYCDGDQRSPHPRVTVPNGDRSFFKDLPQGELFMTVLTPEAGAQFEEGKVTVASFELES